MPSRNIHRKSKKLGTDEKLMVRTKGSPFAALLSPLPALRSSIADLRSLPPPQAAIATSETMVVDKCHTCDLALNRTGEGRPGIRCKDCKNLICNKCGDLTADFCVIAKKIGRDVWSCKECEAKSNDMKAVLDSMNTIKSELGTIRNEQAEQKAERAEVLDGLKTVKEIAKKLDRVEQVQERHGEQLSEHDQAIKENRRRGEEEEQRIKKLEERVEQIGKNDNDGNEVRQFNAVVQEVRELEKRERNIILFNVPEPAGEEEETEEDRREKINEIFKELACEEIKPVKLVRIGKAGRYPRQILTVIPTSIECEKILKRSRDGPKPKNDVFITRDRTFRQRQEAKLFRQEKENEERDGNSTQTGRGRGGRGRGRPRGIGGGRGGRGGRGGQRGDSASASRKRRNSGETVDDETKRQRTGVESGAEGGAGGINVTVSNTPVRAGPTSEHQPTPRPPSVSELGAVGGEEPESF